MDTETTARRRRQCKSRKVQLPEKTIRNKKKPGWKAVGGEPNLGIRITVTKAGKLSRRWSFKYVGPDGKAHEPGGGSLSRISTEAALEWAREGNEMLSRGIDPMTVWNARKGSKTFPSAPNADGRTFGEVFDEFCKLQDWRASTRASMTLMAEVRHYPRLRGLPIGAVEESDIAAALTTRTVHTAERLHWFIRAMLDWAIRQKYRAAPNPAAFVLADKMAIPDARKRKPNHLKAMEYTDMPVFVRDLMQAQRIAPTPQNKITAQCLEWAMRMGRRPCEGCGLTWDEIVDLDLDSGALWLPLGERMKNDEDHASPMPEQVVRILKEREAAGGRSESKFVFPAPYGGPMDSGELLSLIPNPLKPWKKGERVRGRDPTTHGSARSGFGRWAFKNGFALDLIDQQLAHKIGSKALRPYIRPEETTRVPERRAMMEKWNAFLDSAPPAEIDHDAHVRAWERERRIAASPIVSKSEAAEALGIQRSTFTMMLKRGAIHGPAITGLGINLEAAREQTQNRWRS